MQRRQRRRKFFQVAVQEKTYMTATAKITELLAVHLKLMKLLDVHIGQTLFPPPSSPHALHPKLLLSTLISF